MAATLDFSKFTFSDEEIRAIKELVFDNVIEAPEVSLIHNVFNDIRTNKEIGFVGQGGLVGVASNGCDIVPQDYTISTRTVKWQPADWEVLIHDCWKDLKSTAALYSLKTGTEQPDFTNTDYMTIVQDVLERSMKEFIIRFAWFNDKDAANAIVEKLPLATLDTTAAGEALPVGSVYEAIESTVTGAVKTATSEKVVVYLAAAVSTGNAVSGKFYYAKSATETITVVSGGNITPGVPVKYFNLINGFWKQLLTHITTHQEQHVSISENAGATYAAQALSKTNVQGYLESLVFNAPVELRQQEGLIIPCTQSFYDAYAKSLQGLGLETLLTNLTDGIKTLTYNGIPLLALPIWDKNIHSYENNGIRLNKPHRAVLTTKNLLAIGTEDIAAFGDLDVWYDRDSRKVKIESMGNGDAKYLNLALFTIAI